MKATTGGAEARRSSPLGRIVRIGRAGLASPTRLGWTTLLVLSLFCAKFGTYRGTGLPVNVFPIGCAVLWTPFYLLAAPVG